MNKAIKLQHKDGDDTFFTTVRVEDVSATVVCNKRGDGEIHLKSGTTLAVSPTAAKKVQNALLNPEG